MKLYLTRRFSQFPHALFAAASVLALTFSVLSQTSHAQTALDEIMKNKEIKIGIPTDFPPYGFVGADLAPRGLDVEMANYSNLQ